jgi:ATP-binding cassette subfamily B protein
MSAKKQDPPESTAPRGTTRSLLRILAGERWRYVLAFGVMVVGIVADFMAPFLSQAVIDAVTDALDGGPRGTQPVAWITRWLGGHAWVLSHMLDCFVIMLLLSGGGALAALLSGRQIALGSERAMARLRTRLFDHIQRLPLSYHDSLETGELVQRCTSDVETIRRFLATNLAHVWRSVVMVLAVIPMMLSVSLRMSVVALSLTLPVVVFSFVFFSRVKRIFKGADEAEGKLTARLQENLTGIRVVRAFARQGYEAERFAEVNTVRRDWHLRLYRSMATFWAMSDFLGGVQVALIVGFGAYWCWEGSISFGTLFIFMVWAYKYVFPLRSLGRLLTEFGKAQVSMGRVMQILDVDEEPQDEQMVQGAAADVEAEALALEFQDVSFSYDGGEVHQLHNISFRVEPGETVALLGPSGSGKSTIVALLLQLYDLQKGTITVGEQDVSELSLTALRHKFSVALQQPYMFSRTVGDNIVMGRDGASRDEMEHAARVAAIHGSIVDFEDAYETMVGERGVTLSGGQRQRISLARAVLRRASVLILDDTLNAIDSETEQDIVEALGGLKQATTLVIAHRFSTLQMADRVLVLDHGRIVQEGNHEALLQEEGLYKRLWEMQTRMEEGEDVG